MASNKEKSNQEEDQQKQSHEISPISPQDAQLYRATAQQNSIDLIRAAEERYAKAKQSGSAALSDTKDAAFQGLCATGTYLTGKGSQAAGYTADIGKKGFETAKDTALTAGQKATDLANQGYEAAKDTTFTAGQKAAELAKQAAVKTKDTGLSAAGFTAEKAKQGYEAAKEGAVASGETAQDYAAATGEKVKKLASETTKSGEEKTEEVRKKVTEKTGKAEDNLGKQSEEVKERIHSLSLGEEEKAGNDTGGRIVVKELEPEIEMEGTGGEPSEGGAGGIFGAVGTAVIEAAVAVKETVFGK